MSSDGDENIRPHSPIPKKKYKLWKSNSDVEIPIRTLQRWEKNAEENSLASCSTFDPVLQNINSCLDDRNCSISDENTSNNSSLNNKDNYCAISDADSEISDFDETESAYMQNNTNVQNDSEKSENDDNFETLIDNDHHSDCENEQDQIQQIVENFLYDNSDITLHKAIVTLMNFYIKHKLTKSALDALLKMLQSFLPKPNKMPTSQYRLIQYIENIAPVSKITKHFYCNECLFYRGTDKKDELCESCLMTKNVSFFFELSIEDQIKHLFENCHLADKICTVAHRDDSISDLTDGSEYIRVNSREGRSKYDLTLILNTDGISLVKSSKSHCWPLMFMIAELPDHLRESYIVLCRLWYDTTHKPLMNTFLYPFCEKLGTYFYKGIDWMNPISYTVCTSRIVAPLIIADAPARAQVLGVQISFRTVFKKFKIY